MSFNILYQGGNDVNANLVSIAVYVDSFAKKLFAEELKIKLQIDAARLTSVAAALARPDFPHVDGLEKASPFKKAANFFVWFVSERPIIDSLPEQIVGKEISGIPNHQNVILAYYMSVDCLHKAKLYHKTGDQEEERILDTKIKVSYHFLCDFVEAFSSAVPAYHFKIVSLLFEQLAYKDNRNAAYPEIF